MKKIVIALIKGYRKYISPMKSTKCPYFPTCSEYGLQAVEKYGVIKGGLLAFWRILRCNPFPREAMTRFLKEGAGLRRK